jgi:HAD superfamily hydrolase (TIGR01509 family)
MTSAPTPALIFDFDGLLVDTESTALEAWQQQFAVHGVDFPLDVWHRHIGSMGSQQAMLAAVRDSGVHFDEAELLAQWHERHAALLRLALLREGVEAFLDEAAALGAKLAVASSATREWLDEHLARVGIRDRFDVVCARDNGRVKPAPDIYLAALAALGVEAEDAIAFEDSPNGIAAAKAAGLFCVAVPNPVTAALALDGADMQVHTFGELTVAGLIDLLPRYRS